MQDPLHFLPVDKWSELQDVFKSDWPRGIPGYYALETQRRWNEQGFHYGFKVYCPYGELWNGMVAVNEKKSFYEVLILCPTNDTEKLEAALRGTKIINWGKLITLPFAPDHIMECVKRVMRHLGVEIKRTIPSKSFVLDNHKPLFSDVSIPPGITFDLLTLEHIDLVDNKWPHRYSTSDWYFEQLINSRNGYGLFKGDKLIAWIFMNEIGALGHLYVLEEYRRNGYAELVLKIVSNIVLKEGRDIFVFCVKENERACKLYTKLGFRIYNDVTWCFLNKNI